MKKTALMLSVLAVFAAAQVQAQTAIEDTDANGTISYDEMTVAFPEMTQESFDEIDIDANGEIDAEEMDVASEAGLLPE